MVRNTEERTPLLRKQKSIKGKFILRNIALTVTAAAMMILLEYTAAMLIQQTFFWIYLLSITGTIVCFVGYFASTWGKPSQMRINLQFMVKTGIFIGFLGAVNLLLVGYSMPSFRTPPPVQAIVSQITMPITILFSMLLLKNIPNWKQGLSVLLVLGGLACSIAPALKDAKFSHVGSTFWIICCIIGNAVTGIQAVFLEHGVKDRENGKPVISPWFAIGIQSLWSWVFLTISLPINYWEFFDGIDKDEFFSLTKDAIFCTFTEKGGYVDVTNPQDSNICHNLFIIIILLCIVVALYNTICAHMEAIDTASYTQIATTVGSSLSAFYFNIKSTSTTIVYSPFSWFNVIAIILIISGTVLYRYFEEGKQEKKITFIDSFMITVPRIESVN